MSGYSDAMAIAANPARARRKDRKELSAPAVPPRQAAKRSDKAAYIQTGATLPRVLYTDVVLKLRRDRDAGKEGPRNYNELVENLLRDWIGPAPKPGR